MFRDDFEFHDDAAPSHLAATARRAAGAAPAERPSRGRGRAAAAPRRIAAAAADRPSSSAGWAPDAEKELQKIPFFVRGKARRNTETLRRRARRGR